MNPSLLLVGAGGHCRSCIEVIESSGKYQIGGVIGLPEEMGASILNYRIIGSDEQLPELIKQCPRALVAVGQIKSARLRMELFSRLLSLGAELPVIVAATATVSRHSHIGDGTVVMHGAIINAGAEVGINCIVNSRALVEHDAQLGNHCHISTGAIVNGGVQIGNECFIGSGAVLHERVRVGDGAVVGARSLIVRDVPPGAIVRDEA